jgi:hypothetical protein
MLTVAEVRDAAASLQLEGCDVSYSRLASKLSCTRSKVSTFVRGIDSLEEEVRVVADTRFPGLVYACAADAIRQRREQVTCAALARQMKKNVRAVDVAVYRHTEWRKCLGILTKFEVKFQRKERLYGDAIQSLQLRGQKVSYHSIAREVGVAQIEGGQVYRDIQKTPDLARWMKRLP